MASFKLSEQFGRSSYASGDIEFETAFNDCFERSTIQTLQSTLRRGSDPDRDLVNAVVNSILKCFAMLVPIKHRFGFVQTDPPPKNLHLVASSKIGNFLNISFHTKQEPLLVLCFLFTRPDLIRRCGPDFWHLVGIAGECPNLVFSNKIRSLPQIAPILPSIQLNFQGGLAPNLVGYIGFLKRSMEDFVNFPSPSIFVPLNRHFKSCIREAILSLRALYFANLKIAEIAKDLKEGAIVFDTQIFLKILSDQGKSIPDDPTPHDLARAYRTLSQFRGTFFQLLNPTKSARKPIGRHLRLVYTSFRYDFL